MGISLQTLRIKDGSCIHYICWLVKNLFVYWSNVYSPPTQHWGSKTCSFTDKTFNHNKHAGSKPATHCNYREVVQNKTLLSDLNFPREKKKKILTLTGLYANNIFFLSEIRNACYKIPLQTLKVK